MTLTKFLTAAAFAGALAFAQGPGGGTRTPPDPQTMIQNRVARLTTLLALTDAQQSQAVTIFTNAYTASQTIQPNLVAARQALDDAVLKNNSAGIDQAAATLGNLSGQLAAINGKADAAFYALLTADQQAKYAALPHGGPGRGGPGDGPGGFGGPAFRPRR